MTYVYVTSTQNGYIRSIHLTYEDAEEFISKQPEWDRTQLSVQRWAIGHLHGIKK